MAAKIACAHTGMMSVTELKSRMHPDNENEHSKKQIEVLAKIIAKNGQRSPIVISKRSGKVTKGHGRIMAVSLLGWEEAAIDEQEYESELEEFNDRVADNEIARYAEFNEDKFLENLKIHDIDVNTQDFEEFGLIDYEIEDSEILGGLTDDNAIPDIPINPRSKNGDVWELGRHRLMCGDSTSTDCVKRLMNGELADMVFTDPPYGVNYQSNMREKSDKFEVLKNDDAFLDIVPVINSFSRGFVFIWSTWKVYGEWLDKTSALGKPSNTIVWFKGGGGIGDLKKTFSTDWELALVWHRGHELTGKRIGSVWSIAKDRAVNYKHPTQKPVELAEEALDKCSKTGYKVLDLFGGSGSTLIACEKMDRSAYLMELDEKYCDVIIKRWQEYTGKKAILESTGESFDELAQRD